MKVDEQVFSVKTKKIYADMIKKEAEDSERTVKYVFENMVLAYFGSKDMEAEKKIRERRAKIEKVLNSIEKDTD